MCQQPHLTLGCRHTSWNFCGFVKAVILLTNRDDHIASFAISLSWVFKARLQSLPWPSGFSSLPHLSSSGMLCPPESQRRSIRNLTKRAPWSLKLRCLAYTTRIQNLQALLQLLLQKLSPLNLKKPSDLNTAPKAPERAERPRAVELPRLEAQATGPAMGTCSKWSISQCGGFRGVAKLKGETASRLAIFRAEWN